MITVETAREWTKAPNTPEATAFLQKLITAATARLARELGRKLDAPDMLEEIKCGGPRSSHHHHHHQGGLGQGLDHLTLDDDITPGEEEDTVVASRTHPTAPWVDVDVADYVLEGRFLRHKSHWPAGRANLRVRYTAGFAVGEGPPELMDLVTQLVGIRWTQRAGSGITQGLKSETLGDYSYTRGDLDSLEAWEEVANKWRRRLV